MKQQIGADTSIEYLVDKVPGALRYLSDQGIRCIICGETIWGTLAEAAIEKGYDQDQIKIFIADLNKMQDV